MRVQFDGARNLEVLRVWCSNCQKAVNYPNIARVGVNSKGYIRGLNEDITRLTGSVIASFTGCAGGYALEKISFCARFFN